MSSSESASAAAAAPAPTPAPTPVPAPAPSPQMPSCLSALGPVPIVNSLPALDSLASQLHVLTAPLPTVQSSLTASALEQGVHSALARMDEFSALLESIKHSTAAAHSDLLPLLARRAESLEPLLQQVHTLDKYTAALERHMTYVESRVAQVDELLKRTDASEKEADAALRGGINAELEQSVKKLWSSIKSFGKSSSESSAASASGISASPSTSSPDAPFVWTPFEACVQFSEFFDAPKSEVSSQAVSSKA